MKSFLLVILAIVIFQILLIPGIIWQIFCYFNDKQSPSYISDVLFSAAQCIDQLGNVVFQEMFNDTLIVKGGSKFGSNIHTISYIIGVNKQSNTLSKVGLVLYNILNKIQPNHCEKAVAANS